MYKLIRFKTTRATRVGAAAVTVAAVVAGAAGIAAGQGNAAPAKDRFNAPTLENGVLTIKGTNKADAIALGQSAVQRGVLQVDVGDDGTADFEFNTADLTQIIVKAGNGDDTVRIDESNGSFSNLIPTTLEGGNGDDTLTGGSGAVTLHGGNGNDKLIGENGDETLFGDNGNDVIDGNKGADRMVGGNGDDTLVWDPGDGSDVVEGQDGFDTMVFNGAGGAETFDLNAIGHRLTFTREPGDITMDTNGVEQIDVNALGGADVVTVNDLSGTDVTKVNVDLAGALGGTAGDGAADSVVVGGTKGDDTIDVSGDAAGVNVTGLATKVNVSHAEPANDSLDIETNGGADIINHAGLAAGVIQFFVDGILIP